MTRAPDGLVEWLDFMYRVAFEDGPERAAVVNAGVTGEEAAEAMRRLAAMIAEPGYWANEC